MRILVVRTDRDEPDIMVCDSVPQVGDNIVWDTFPFIVIGREWAAIEREDGAFAGTAQITIKPSA